MDVATLKAKIKTKQLPSYLIFSGDEWKVQQIYIEQIAKVTKKSTSRIDSISEIYSQLRNKAFVQISKIYIVRDDKELMQNEKLQAQVDSGLLKDNILIHILTTTDKRTKFYKKYKDKIIEFEPLSDALLKKYIKKEIDLSDRNCQRLIEICEHDYGRCLLEIDKIRRFYNWNTAPNVTFDDCFKVLLEEGVFFVPARDAIFNFVDEVLNRKLNNLFDLLQECYDVGEATLVMLSVLYNNAKAVLQVQTCHNNDVVKSTGLTGWQIKNAKPHVGKYTDEELENMLKLIQKCESGIKSGRIEEQFVMPYLLVRIL